MDTGAVELVASRICAAARVTVMTGAGVSAASGVPTFRGAGGLWREFRAEDLATQCRVVTQNVDDLHLRAGTPDVIRLHGSICELCCSARCGQPRWRDERVPLTEMPPRCPRCGRLARPGVVWFGESLDTAAVAAAERAASCDVFLAVGTSSLVYPAAGFMHEARDRGAFTVEINPEATAVSDLVDVALPAGAEVVLPRIEALLTAGSGNIA